MNQPRRSPDWLQRIRTLVSERRDSSNWRSLTIRDEVKVALPRTIDLSSNDYLALSRHPLLIDCVRDAAARWGVGSGSSRLVSGTLPIHAALERRFAKFKHAEAALLFPTGYVANLAVLSTIPQPGDLLVLDKLCHASLIDGGRLATATGATMRTFPHGRLDRLSTLLADHQIEKPDAARFIVSDAVFSMDGDCADLPRLAELRDAHDAALILDEAHATGVLGERGEGLDAAGLADITISTASKALGSLGGVVTGPVDVIEWLINAARPFIYTTASSPLQAAAIEAALDVIDAEPRRRTRMAALVHLVRLRLNELGLATPMDPTPIIPIVVGSAQRAIALSAHLRASDIIAPAIRPPTVAPNASRVRLSLHCELTDDDLDQLFRSLASFDWDQQQ